MNDTSPKLTVIATRMPYIDRRSLSQAWFSALHLASDGAPASAPPERRNAIATRDAVRPNRAAATSTCPAPSARANATSRTSSPQAVRADAQIAIRRTYDARLAAAARTSFDRARSYPPFQTSLTLESKGDRVQLLLRREGATLHVVALCRPEIAETVRRALACADTHVRLRGENIASSVRAIGSGEETV